MLLLQEVRNMSQDNYKQITAEKTKKQLCIGNDRYGADLLTFWGWENENSRLIHAV